MYAKYEQIFTIPIGKWIFLFSTRRRFLVAKLRNLWFCIFFSKNLKWTRTQTCLALIGKISFLSFLDVLKLHFDTLLSTRQHAYFSCFLWFFISSIRARHIVFFDYFTFSQKNLRKHKFLAFTTGNRLLVKYSKIHLPMGIVKICSYLAYIYKRFCSKIINFWVFFSASQPL